MTDYRVLGYVELGAGGGSATWGTLSGRPTVMSEVEAAAGTATTERTINAAVLKATIEALAADSAAVADLVTRVTAAESALEAIPVPPDWGTIADKPPYVAAGVNKAAAREAIEAAADSDLAGVAGDLSDLAAVVAGLGSGGGASEVLVWRYTAGAWPAIPATAPAGIKMVQAIGPSQPSSVPSWIGPGAGKVPGFYFYAPLA